MKKAIKTTHKYMYLALVFTASILIYSCGGCGSSNPYSPHSSNTNYSGSHIINGNCAGATTKSNFERMKTSLTRNDKATFDQMLFEGSLVSVSKGEKVSVIDMGFDYVKVRVNGQELYVLSVYVD